MIRRERAPLLHRSTRAHRIALKIMKAGAQTAKIKMCVGDEAGKCHLRAKLLELVGTGGQP